MWQYNYSDELCHYGTPGMKWGRRKAKAASGSDPKAGAKKQDTGANQKKGKKMSSKTKKSMGIAAAVLGTIGVATVATVAATKLGKGKEAANSLLRLSASIPVDIGNDFLFYQK